VRGEFETDRERDQCCTMLYMCRALAYLLVHNVSCREFVLFSALLE
jgi:hypothetical protein